MFLAASKVKTWKSGLTDNRFLKTDSNFLSVTISVKKALNFCEYLIHNISSFMFLTKEKTWKWTLTRSEVCCIQF